MKSEKAVAMGIVFALIVLMLIIFIGTASAALPIDSVMGTVEQKTDTKLEIHTEWKSGDFGGHGWNHFESTLELPFEFFDSEIVDVVWDEISVGDYVEVSGFHCMGEEQVCLANCLCIAKVKSSGDGLADKNITDIYGDPALLSWRWGDEPFKYDPPLLGNFDIEYDNKPDCPDCPPGCICEAEYTNIKISKEGDLIDTFSLYPGQNRVYEGGEHRIDVTFFSGATQCCFGGQVPSNFVIHIAPTTEDRYALIIGINEYNTGDPNLKFPVNNAEGIKELLTKGFEYKNVVLLTSTDETSSRSIRGAYKDFADKTNNGQNTLFYYHSGHGDKDMPGFINKEYIPTYDGRIYDHKIFWLINDPFYPKEGLREYFNSVQNIGIIFDTCYSGGFCTATDKSTDVLGLDGGGIDDGTDQIILMSSQSEYEVWDNIREEKYFLFTKYFLEAFTTRQGREAANKPGSDPRISLEEAFKYARDNCKEDEHYKYAWVKDDKGNWQKGNRINNIPVIADNYEDEFYLSDRIINNYWAASTHSPIHLHAYNSEGRHTGFDPDNLFDNEIPGSYYSGPTGDETIIFFDPSLLDEIKFEIEAYNEGEFDLVLNQFINGEISSKGFRNIQITENSVGYITMSQGGIQNELSLDIDGNDVIDDVIESSGLPFAEFTYSPAFLAVDETITFDAYLSTDLDGAIESWEWDFGDGSTETGKIVNHSYSSAGNYDVTLTVTDDKGAMDKTTEKITVSKVSNIIYVPDNYPTIQAAVNAATLGETIIVRDGVYTENIDVNKRLTIKSDNSAEKTTVQAANSRDHVFEVTANYVTISGFTVKGATKGEAGVGRAGICLNSVEYCNIIHNTLCNNYLGIQLGNSNHNTLNGNIVHHNIHDGIRVAFSNRNDLKNNTMNLNNVNGLAVLYSSNNNAITDNIFYSNAIYLQTNAEFNLILSNEIYSSSEGIVLHDCNSNYIKNNNIHDNTISGIRLTHNSNNNIISNNQVSSNNNGMCLYFSSNNSIYQNNFINNNENARSTSSTNIWNSPSKITYTYNDNTHTSYLGNYWDDYTESDANGDGIGDTAYNINSDKDNYPLMERFENYFEPPSPLKGKIVFHSNRDNNFEMYVMDADGTNQTRLTRNVGNDQYAVWSSDSTKIAFTSEKDGNQEIYVMSPDGSNQVRLTFNNASDWVPDFSPDSKKIVFTSNCDGRNAIYIMNSDGSNQIRLTENDADDRGPDWSINNKIAFESNRDGNSEIYVMDADGTNVIRLTDSNAVDRHPAWSPGGSRIAFTSNRDGNDEIYVMNADGDNRVRITYNTASDLDPAWSPDGNYIAFASNRDGNYEIYVMNVDGGNQRKLTVNTNEDYHPDWGLTVSSLLVVANSRTDRSAFMKREGW